MSLEWKIRSATTADCAAVLDWLRDESVRKHESFWGNRRVIQACHDDGEMIVIVDVTTDAPVGFLTGSPRKTELPIVEIREGFRGRGLGRRLVQSHIDQAIEAGLAGLIVERTPHTSVPFWTAMGFENLPNPPLYQRIGYYNRAHAIRVFDIPLGFEAEMQPVIIEVQISTETGEQTFSGRIKARRHPATTFPIQLERRFVVFAPDPDLYIEYQTEGEVLCDRQKLKYSESQLVACYPFYILEQLAEQKCEALH